MAIEVSISSILLKVIVYFRFRKGALYFLHKLSMCPNVELVLYTNTPHQQWDPMKHALLHKTRGLLSIGEGFEYSPSGVNYKLFQNSCACESSFYYKKLSRKCCHQTHMY